ncbi:MAG: hypothetical protein JWO98_2251, partial [Frankiales bacterium]|nr:hypothetical protein [Frankiales bacterium]
MAYNVGEVEVSVFPNAERFNEILGAKLTPRARGIGRDMGDQMADGIRERLAVLGDVNLGVDTTKANLEVDKFLAETKAKAALAGDDAGKKLGSNLAGSAASSARGGSPLIMAAIAGGLLAGGPLLIGAAGVVFGGLAALILHNQQNVANAASGMAHAVTAEYTKVAQVAVPFLVKALDDVKASAMSMSGAVGEVFSNLGPAVDGVTHGVLALVQNALPGLAAAVRTGTPVFQGLDNLLASVGTGLGNMFTLISQHAPAMGTVLSSLGGILDALLTGLGSLVSAGGELGSVVLPPLAVALQALASVLQV